MDSLRKSSYSDLGSEFYSEESFEFHPLADEFPLMNSEEIAQLGKDIAKHGQDDTIDLYEGKILDGRNRYLACKEYGVTPRLRYLPEGKNPEDYVFSKNFLRRHLTPAQKAEKALRWVEIEAKRAKNRKLSKLKQFKGQITDHPSEGLTVSQGQAVKIVAKKGKISQNSIYIAKKVKHLNDPEINDRWEDAKNGEATIKSVDRLIREKFPPSKPKRKNKLTTRPVQKTSKDATQLEREIHKHTMNNFLEKGNKIKSKHDTTPLENEKDKRNLCKYCPKATVLAIGHQYNCEKCGHQGYVYISKVMCDNDFITGEKRLRDPQRKRCESSYLEEELYS